MKNLEMINELTERLIEAKNVIRIFHGMGVSEQLEKKMWAIYEAQSPEIRRMNASIDKAQKLIDDYKNNKHLCTGCKTNEHIVLEGLQQFCTRCKIYV